MSASTKGVDHANQNSIATALITLIHHFIVHPVQQRAGQSDTASTAAAAAGLVGAKRARWVNGNALV